MIFVKYNFLTKTGTLFRNPGFSLLMGWVIL